MAVGKALKAAVMGQQRAALASLSQVPMSAIEKNKFVNYERIESNLKVVRDR